MIEPSRDDGRSFHITLRWRGWMLRDWRLYRWREHRGGPKRTIRWFQWDRVDPLSLVPYIERRG